MGRELVPVCEPGDDPLVALFGEAVELGAIARRHDEGFAHAGHARQLPQRVRQLLARKHHFLADLDGRGAVVDSYDEERHAVIWRTSGIVSVPSRDDKRGRVGGKSTRSPDLNGAQSVFNGLVFNSLLELMYPSSMNPKSTTPGAGGAVKLCLAMLAALALCACAGAPEP